MGEFTRFDDWSQQRLPRLLRVPEHLSMAAQLKRVCEQLDVAYVDSTEALRTEAADGEMVFYPSDTHLSPRGHEVISRLIVDAIRDIGSHAGRPRRATE
jgi:lysophospholipase L1-like esterase